MGSVNLKDAYLQMPSLRSQESSSVPFWAMSVQGALLQAVGSSLSIHSHIHIDVNMNELEWHSFYLLPYNWPVIAQTI